MNAADFRALQAIFERGIPMSAPDRASVVGQNVYHEGEQVPFGTVFAYLGETDGTHYYGVTNDAGTHIYPAGDLRVMHADGLRGLLEDAPAAGALDTDPSAPHPFEQVGKAGDSPVTSVMDAADAGRLSTPAYGPDFGEYQDFLRWRASRRDHGSTHDATPLSPAEAQHADAGAIEGGTVDPADAPGTPEYDAAHGIDYQGLTDPKAGNLGTDQADPTAEPDSPAAVPAPAVKGKEKA